MMYKQVLTAAVTAALACAVQAAEYKLTKGDASGSSSVTSWDVSGENIGAPRAENDYYTDGLTMRAVNNSASSVFKGKSLHIGRLSPYSATGALAYPGSGSKKFLVENDGLFLEQGRIVPYSAKQQLALEGKVTVVNTKPDNFYIGTADANHSNFTNNFSGTLIGGKTAYLNYRARSTGCFAYLRTGMDQYEGTLKIARMATVDEPMVIEYRNGWTMPGTLILGADEYLYPQFGTSHGTVGSLVLENGAILGARSGSADYATITITDSVSIGESIIWRYAAQLYAGNGYNVPFLIKKAGATGELNPQNFKETTVDRVFHECLPRYWFEVTTAANGDETLSYVQPAVIQIKSDDGTIYGEIWEHSSLADLTMMQDGKTPHSDCDYVITKNGFAGNTGKNFQGSYLYTPTDLINKPYEFAGKSLTIGTGCTFKSAANPLTIDTLRLTGNSWFFPRVNSGTATTLEGHEIFIGPEVADENGNLQPAMIDVYGNLTWTVKPALTGEGRLKFRANAGSGKPAGTIVLQGLSADFRGKLLVSATGWDATKLTSSVNECVKVSDARQLGGALATFTADALALENWGTLEATADVDFSTVNRGVTVGNIGQMRVAAGKTLTIGNKVTLNGELHKAGAGRLVLGAASEAAEGAALKVDAGSVQAADGALAGVAVTFAEGTTLAVDATSTSATGARLGSVTGTVAVELVYPADAEDLRVEKVALCTAPSATEVTAVRPKGYRVVLTSTDNGDGTATTFAEVTKAGLAIILR